MGGEWTPHTPDWVTLDEAEISDVHWLSYAMLAQDRLPWAAGVCASIAWIRGGRIGPITGRDEQPVTRPIADAERWAAEAARDPRHPPPMDWVYEHFKVAPWPPLPDQDPKYAMGCWSALRWVLSVPGQDPPLAVPRRHPDGRVYVAEDIYAERTRGDDGHLGPERRREIRHYAESLAARYWHAAVRIAEIKRELTSAS